MSTTQETLSRLERLRTSGAFDGAKSAIDRGAPILSELGVSNDQARAALEAAPNELESAVGMLPAQLEAIVLATNRPPLIVEGGKVKDKASAIAAFGAGIDIKIASVEHLIPSVGRIEFRNHDLSWGGTGWVIAEDGPDHLLIITNRHVAKLVARRTFRGDGVFMFSPANVPYEASIDFVEEAGNSPLVQRELKLESFTYLADDAAADIALARVSRPSASAGFSVAPIQPADDDGDNDELVAVVGYPASDPFRNDRTQMERYFRGLYDVKRFSPGKLRVQGGPSILGHDCTTLGGNSGSPVISLESGKAVGLHFAGQFGVGNSAVRISTVKSVLDNGASGQVHVVSTTAGGSGAESRDGTHDMAFFDGRDGYDPDFLQVASVPLPDLPSAIPLATPQDATADRPHEIRYQHFGILYRTDFKSPVIAALNLDGSKTRAIKRSNSRWFKDLRIPADTQLSREEYGDPAIDRGHMIRRAATNWGEDDETAKRSNLDSYHYTVASPQHLGLNRNTRTWLGLENHIMENARTHGFRANVFTGPIFGDRDPELGTTGVPIPMSFFKVVTMLAEEPGTQGIVRLNATAYILSQGQLIQKMMRDRGLVESAEGFVFGAFKTFQVRIRDLETETGYDFGPLRDADPLDKLQQEGPAPRSGFVLESLESIVL